MSVVVLVPFRVGDSNTASDHLLLANCTENIMGSEMMPNHTDALSDPVNARKGDDSGCGGVENEVGAVKVSISEDSHGGSVEILALIAKSKFNWIATKCRGQRYRSPRSRLFQGQGKTECLVLESDGLWDVMMNEEVCDLAGKRLLLWNKKNGASHLTDRGEDIDLSSRALQKGSKDNITVVVVDLKAQRKFKSKA